MEKIGVEDAQTKTIEHLLTRKTDRTTIQLFRYTFVGGFAFLIDFSILFVLTDFWAIHYLVSAAIAFAFGVLANYILSIFWVFQVRTIKNRFMEILIFTFIGIIGLGLNELCMWFFTEGIRLHYLASKAFATVLVYFWNFFVRKLILFR